MEIRWSPAAVADLTQISEHIRRDDAAVAIRVAREICQNISELNKFPNRGRAGRVPGTRELVLSPLPFLVVYRVKEDAVEIARILHGAQRWP